MNEAMVSVRMPKSLVDELKELVKKHHFLDLSEEIRSIARQKWLSQVQPEIFELRKLRENIELELKNKSARKVQEEVAKELDKIKSSLKNFENGK